MEIDASRDGIRDAIDILMALAVPIPKAPLEPL